MYFLSLLYFVISILSLTTRFTLVQAQVHLAARLLNLSGGRGGHIRSIPKLQPFQAVLGTQVRPAGQVLCIMGSKAQMGNQSLGKIVQKAVSFSGVHSIPCEAVRHPLSRVTALQCRKQSFGAGHIVGGNVLVPCNKAHDIQYLLAPVPLY